MAAAPPLGPSGADDAPSRRSAGALRDPLASGAGTALASAPLGRAATGAGASKTGVVTVAGGDDGVGAVGAAGAGVAGADGASATGGGSGATAGAGGTTASAGGGGSTRGAAGWAGIADSDDGGVLFGFGGGGRRTGAGGAVGAGATAVVAAGVAGESRSVNSSMKTLSRGRVASTSTSAAVTSTTWIASDAVIGTRRAVGRAEVSMARTRTFIPGHNRRFQSAEPWLSRAGSHTTVSPVRRSVLALVALALVGLLGPALAHAHSGGLAVAPAPLVPLELPATSLRAAAPAIPPVALLLGLAAGALLALAARSRPRRALVLALTLLLVVFAVEAGV